MSRNLILSFVLHCMLISAVAGGALRGASKIPLVGPMMVFLSSDPEPADQRSGTKKIDTLHRAYPAPGREDGHTGRKPENISSPVVTAKPAGSLAPSVGRKVLPPEQQEFINRTVETGYGDPGNAGAASSGKALPADNRQLTHNYSQERSAAPVLQGIRPAVQSGGEDFARKIGDAVHKSKYYPLIAKKRGIEGRATVEFTINIRGNPENIRIIRSSGSEILDSAAVETITRAAPLPLATGKVEVPITFRLKDRE